LWHQSTNALVEFFSFLLLRFAMAATAEAAERFLLLQQSHSLLDNRLYCRRVVLDE
jgi:hypothetical protein